MTGLFDPARHEPLQAPPWDEAVAREAIRRIADSVVAAYEPGWAGARIRSTIPRPRSSDFTISISAQAA